MDFFASFQSETFLSLFFVCLFVCLFLRAKGTNWLPHWLKNWLGFRRGERHFDFAYSAAILGGRALLPLSDPDWVDKSASDLSLAPKFLMAKGKAFLLTTIASKYPRGGCVRYNPITVPK